MAVRPATSDNPERRAPAKTAALFLATSATHGATSTANTKTSRLSQRVHTEERSVVRSRRPKNLRPREPVLRIRASSPSPRRRRRVEPQGEAECIPLAKDSNAGRKTAKAYRQTGEVVRQRLFGRDSGIRDRFAYLRHVRVCLVNSLRLVGRRIVSVSQVAPVAPRVASTSAGLAAEGKAARLWHGRKPDSNR